MKTPNNIFMEALPTMVALTAYVTPALDDEEFIRDIVLGMLSDQDDLLTLLIGQSVWIHVLLENLESSGIIDSVPAYLQRLGISALTARGDI